MAMVIVEDKEPEGENMSIGQIIVFGIVMYYGYKYLNILLDTPIRFKRKRLSKEEMDIYLALVKKVVYETKKLST